MNALKDFVLVFETTLYYCLISFSLVRAAPSLSNETTTPRAKRHAAPIKRGNIRMRSYNFVLKGILSEGHFCLIALTLSHSYKRLHFIFRNFFQSYWPSSFFSKVCSKLQSFTWNAATFSTNFCSNGIKNQQIARHNTEVTCVRLWF